MFGNGTGAELPYKIRCARALMSKVSHKPVRIFVSLTEPALRLIRKKGKQQRTWDVLVLLPPTIIPNILRWWISYAGWWGPFSCALGLCPGPTGFFDSDARGICGECFRSILLGKTAIGTVPQNWFLPPVVHPPSFATLYLLFHTFFVALADKLIFEICVAGWFTPSAASWILFCYACWTSQLLAI